MELTLDDLLGGKLKLYQPKVGQRQTMDTILLAGFCRPGRGKIIELGSGTGAAALILSWRTGSPVEGVELDSDLVTMSNDSARLNGLDCSFRQGDLRRLETLPQGGYGTVLVNPPYQEEGKGLPSHHLSRRQARQGQGCSLAQVFAAGAHLLGSKGKLFMILRSDRLPEAMSLAQNHRLMPIECQPVYAKEGKEAFAFLLACRKEGKGGFLLRQPLFLQKEGQISEQFATFYEKEGPQWL